MPLVSKKEALLSIFKHVSKAILREKFGLTRPQLKVVDTANQPPKYEQDVPVKSYVIKKRGQVPEMYEEKEELLVPTFEVVSCPTIKLSDIKALKDYYWLMDGLEEDDASS